MGGVLVYDVTNELSFQHIEQWMEEAKSHVVPHDIIFVLIGQKADLESERKVCNYKHQ